MKAALTWLLIASLCVNAYLLWQLNRAQPAVDYQGLATEPPSEPMTSARAHSEHYQMPDAAERVRVAANDTVTVTIPDEGVTLSFLQKLKQQKAYEALSFHVRTYLRTHPQDIDALLLEAEAYYYTQPLNTALVNYYGLRDALISDVQLEQINRIIDVNTTRIIQQFSGDGSWDLLAAFLEPLIQVDPLNRRYLMALAKAYGMQQQPVLMENVLAALPRNDVRAERLRDSIYTADEQQNPPLLSAADAEQNFSQILEGEVPLTARNGQYYTQVRFASVDADLLIDTGASTTAISQQIFNQIAVSDTAYLGTFNVQTAGGVVSSPIYRIAEFQVGDERLNNVSVMVLPTENLENFDGLLGMNVIKQFNVSFDQSVGSMRMYKRIRPLQ